ncbi:hypothetical protein [Spiroplasma endosymbiont of Diplazon laetatorius]|uniref:hypothetical protein n=1 Tax=Spiroplasma endosymbiont of Diplazon laetatorius TaxID=3066322 RepID=UPI0030CC8993
MKTKEIKEEFSDYIKYGYKNFEIRKDGDLEGEVELIVVEHNSICKEKYLIHEDNYNFEECIKDRLKVRLKKTNYSAYEIGCRIAQEIILENDTATVKWKMYQKVNKFLLDWFKQGDKLYWYYITHIYLDDKWVEYRNRG